jgi:hypothetical protein
MIVWYLQRDIHAYNKNKHIIYMTWPPFLDSEKLYYERDLWHMHTSYVDFILRPSVVLIDFLP